MCACYVLGMMLGAGDMVANKMDMALAQEKLIV